MHVRPERGIRAVEWRSERAFRWGAGELVAEKIVSRPPRHDHAAPVLRARPDLVARALHAFLGEKSRIRLFRAEQHACILRMRFAEPVLLDRCDHLSRRE